MTEIISQIKKSIKNTLSIATSNETKSGIEALKSKMGKGKTYCLLGSSGVGKSTLLNNLSGKQIMNTNTISTSTNKGRHITSHRELVILGNGSILIDNPGMREVGIVNSTDGLELTFSEIMELSKKCKFKNCTHRTEINCAVIEAVKNDEIDRSSYENYLKIEREREHFESTTLEKRKKDKEFGKMIKNYKKNMKKSKKY